MKIAIVGPVYPYRGGIAHYTTMLWRALQEQGHQATVYSFKRQYPTWLYPGASDKDPSPQPWRAAAEYILDPLYPWTWMQATRHINTYQPDKVVFQWWTTFWAPAYIYIGKYINRTQKVFLVHNVLPHERRPWDIGLARMAFGQADTFIVQTQVEQERLLALVPDAQVAICPHPIYRMFSPNKISKKEARRRYNLPQDRPILLFFGIVRPYKGLNYLLEAMRLLREDDLLAAGGTPAANRRLPYLVIAGEFWDDPAAYQLQIEQAGLDEYVRVENHYLPNDEVEILFSAADMLVAPYTGGTQSGAVSMALGFGLPVILTETIAVGIAQENQQYTHIVPPKDAPALAASIRSLLARPEAFYEDRQPAQDDWVRLVRTILGL
jgi:glycosyltransferase involved in cell wall biosynthesis